MARYLVTGGAGFIGSNLAESLVKKGHFVRVLDNFSYGKRENLKFAGGTGRIRLEIVKGDIRDKDICQKVTRGVDYILHHAALRSVPQSLENPDLYNDVNIKGTLFLLQAALKNRVKRFVFASSSAVYGNSTSFQQKEEHLPNPISPYGLTKLTGEYYCRIFSEVFGLETVCLRYFNVFGPRQSLDSEYASVIPKFISSILKNQQPPIFGNGKQLRDFVFVDNVVLANVLAAQAKNAGGGVFNIAAGESYSVLKIVAEINKITGKSIGPKFFPKRPGDAFKTRADISKAGKILKYKPCVSFKSGLQETVEYFQKNFHF